MVGWSYDVAGNLLSDGTTTYTYDALGRTITQGGVAYAYNGDGVLVQAGATQYVQDLAAPLSQILNDGSANYVYGLDRLASSAGTWYLGDALGSVRQTLDASGAVLSTASYDPWGTPVSGMIAPFGFTGELQDGAGQVYLRARWYDTGTGRFTSRDPFAGWPEQPASLSYYSYAANDPTLYTDSSGECYGKLEWLRNVEPGNCANLDKAVIIWHSPQASLSDKGWAYGYAFSFYVGHSAIVAAALPKAVGAPIVGGTKAAVGWLLSIGGTWLTNQLQGCQNRGNIVPAAANAASADGDPTNEVRAVAERAPVIQDQAGRLVQELIQAGVKVSPDKIVRINRMSSGQIVFLETGTPKAGLEHIVQRHLSQFVGKGISQGQIPDAIMAALMRGEAIKQARDGILYKVSFNGVVQHIQVVVSSNGYIVTAHPASP